MTYKIFYIIHLVSLFFLVGFTFQAIASKDDTDRKKILMWSGIFSLAALLAGFALLGIAKLGVPGWAIVKFLCWLLLSGIAGMVFRMRGKSELFYWLTAFLVILAVSMVTLRPF